MTDSAATAKALRRAFRVAPALSRGLAWTLVLAVLGTALQLVVPVTVQRIIDSGVLVSDGVDVSTVLWQGFIALLALGMAAWARRVSLARLARSASTGLSDLRVAAFSHLHRLSILHVQGERRGALVSRVTSDVETMQDFMEWGGVGLVLGTAQLLLAVTLMVVYQWQLAVLIAVGVLLYSALLLLFQRILRGAHDAVRERVADSLAAIGEGISGLSTVRAYGMEESVTEKVNEALDRQFVAEWKTGALAAGLFSSAELFSGLITAAVIAVGVVFGVGWGMSAGTLVAFLFLVTLLVEPVQMLVETINQAQSAGAGLRKILTVLDTEIDVADPVDGAALPEGGLDIRFEAVRYRYPTGNDVLRDVTVHIAAGGRVAVVGETGSGKTTFAKLATRLLDPGDGSVSIGGVPLDRVAFSSLRTRVAYVPQEGFLFDGSVADNVRYGRPGVSDAGIRVAFADLGLLDWANELPNGLETGVGERGGNLSSGERQVVAIVRAWVANPDVLVLDEATSAVDPALEVQIRRAMERLTAGRTSLTVAHRLSTAETADEVLVFDAGRLVEQGPHERLVGSGGVYAGLHADWAGTGSSGR